MTPLFDTLNFRNHPNFEGGTTAWLAFGNGYKASVITGGYGSAGSPYEVAVLDSEGLLTYDTPVTNDVVGNLCREGVEKILEQIKALTPREEK